MQAISIDNALYAEACFYAERKGMSITELVEKYLKRVLRPRTNSAEKEKLLAQIDHALKDFKLIEEGKLKTRPAEDLLNEL